jgi:hypothetical protein
VNPFRAIKPSVPPEHNRKALMAKPPSGKLSTHSPLAVPRFRVAWDGRNSRQKARPLKLPPGNSDAWNATDRAGNEIGVTTGRDRHL